MDTIIWPLVEQLLPILFSAMAFVGGAQIHRTIAEPYLRYPYAVAAAAMVGALTYGYDSDPSRAAVFFLSLAIPAVIGVVWSKRYVVVRRQDAERLVRYDLKVEQDLFAPGPIDTP